MLAKAILTASFCAWAVGALAAPPNLTPQPFVSGLSLPVEIAHANDFTRRLFVAEQAGRIRVIRDGQLLATPFLDLSPGSGFSPPVQSGGEQGLLGLAFHPQYAANGRFYVYYTRAPSGGAGGNEIVVQRFNRSANDPDVADRASASIVLTIPHPQFANHNGGKIAFGPDGYLYIGVGDGGGGGDPFNAAQSLADLRGKILRIDVDGGTPYAVPTSNPYWGTVGIPENPPVRWEIWDHGLRNPWRFSFDRATGDLFIADVGQNAWEEIDFEPAASGGRNYGWSVFEGTHCYNPPANCGLAGHVPPVIEYPHNSSGGFSVTGGYRYRGSTLPALSGYYVYGDYVSGRVWAAAPDGNGTWVPTQVATLSGISTFGEDQDGELYVANHGAGTIQRLTPSAGTIPRLVGISTRVQVLTGDDVGIAGFIVGGSSAKTVVVRARGPSLGIAGSLADPTLTLVPASGAPVGNDDWGGAANAAVVAASGYAPSHAKESAILATLAPGAYTAIVSGVGATSGVAIVEVYELGNAAIPLVGISTRGPVGTGENVMIGGFIIQGDAPRTVIIRARGPSLAPAVPNALANPTLQLFAGGALIAGNDDWGSASNAAQVQASGFAPAHPLESAILVTLNPGAYTAILSGVGGGTGVGIVEVYQQ